MRIIITSLNRRIIDYIRSSDPDLIILSLSKQMKPELEFITQLKKDTFTESIPVLAILPDKDENFIINYKLLGFTDYLIKPYSKLVLLEKVQNIIKEYNHLKKYKADSVDSHIEVVSKGFNTTIYLKSSLSHYVAPEIKDTLSRSMLQKLKDDTIAIDVRGLFIIQKSEIKILQQIVSLFEGKKVYFIGGKFTGFLVENGLGAMGETIFVTPEEFSQYLVENKS